MLSVIVYGRNDSHGYNPHKRVAISLNTIAETLGDDDDEILFVDYNTPDELPTLPEALADTLTAKARQRLRVIRVRPAHHAPHSRHTDMAVIEPVARNVALLRANPRNPWILSTNTDMVFLTTRPEDTLDRLVADLPPAHYCAPRFELPEAVWEGFDRRDPQGTLALVRSLGPRLHLNETVFGLEDALYDNPGDCQLIWRADLEAIHGFDETMVNGWIVDSNIAKRLTMLRGPAKSLAEQVVGYHCSHARMATTLARHDHVENDFRRYYAELARPDLPRQAGSWGLADVELEEIRLAHDRTAAFADAVAACLPPPCGGYVADYRPDRRDSPTYPPEHVLPFLADLITPLPRTTRFGWFGGCARTLDLFTECLSRLGFALPPNVGHGPERAILEQSDAFIVDFGAEAPEDLQARLDRLAPVKQAFDALMDHEERLVATGGRPRWVITINANHTRFEPTVMERLGAARIPFTSRLRHGTVKVPAPATAGWRWTPTAIVQWLPSRLGRPALPITEAVRLQSHMAELLADFPAPERLRQMARSAPALMALLDHPAVVAQAAARQVDVAGLREKLAAARASATICKVGVDRGRPPAAETAPCRLAAIEDWDDADFLRLAGRHFQGPFAANHFRRSARQWAEIHLLRILLSHQTLDRSTSVLVAAGHAAGDLPGVLSTLAGQVILTGPDRAALMEEVLAHGWPVPSRVTFEPLLGREDTAVDAAILLPGCGWERREQPEGAAILARAVARLRTGGLLALAGDIAIGGTPAPQAFPPRWGASAAFAEAMARLGLERLPAAAVVSDATLDQLAETAEEQASHHFVTRRDGTLWLESCWFFVKRDGRPSAAALRDALHPATPP